ncbi:arsenate reductase (glutaredoxin) [Nisaea nitritireducens]|uniref:arsenate reductase (glutaredoxin) n=1 Tax=Nisaea nitritireducens TaxID=568392 RepID=UPI001866E322|nr:arsenate reductase (glutaredoxin) [Nisaea nitritireducens]
MSVVIYHNPRCSKSRQTLELLRSNGVEPEIREYLKSPPSAAEIEELLGLLGMEPVALMRRKEAPFKELGLGDSSKDRATLVQAMHDNPVLIERPIVIANGKAAIGRPPEDVLKIL